jgi:hypothetical protein
MDPADGCVGVARAGLYKSLIDQRTVWTQRIHAELFQHGVAVPEGQIRSAATRAWLAGDEVTLTPAARQRIQVGHAMIDAVAAEAGPLNNQLQRFGTRQPACRALTDAAYGIGGLLAVAIWCEPGPDGPATMNQMGRGALEVTIRAGGRDVTIVNCHLKSKLLSYPDGRFSPRDENERARFAAYALFRRTSEAATLRHHITDRLDDRGRQYPFVLAGARRATTLGDQHWHSSRVADRAHTRDTETRRRHHRNAQITACLCACNK